MNTHKLVFIGAAGVGKTTAIRAVSDDRPVDAGALLIPALGNISVVLDVGELTLDDGDVLHLYGIAGDENFDALRPLLGEGVMGLVILIDSTRPDSLATLERHLTWSAELIGAVPAIVVLNRQDAAAATSPEDHVRHLAQCGLDLPVVAIDPRERDDVLYLINMIVAMVARGNMV